MRLLGPLLLLVACAAPASAVPTPAPPPSRGAGGPTPAPPVSAATPDPDGDADGVRDRVDHCPDALETRNDHLDDDGCPDERAVGRGYFLNGLAGVPFRRPPPLPRAGADAPVAYFFATSDPLTAENYAYVSPDRFVAPAERPRSTLAANADTSAVPLLRRFLARGSAPPAGILRAEALVDYFDDDTPPTGDEPLAIGSEVGPCPWAPAHRLVRIRVQAADALPPPRLFVLMIDVSGSMGAPERLPLLRHGLTALLDGLRADDRVALVGFAGTAKVALPPTPMHARADIEAAVAALRADGTERWWPGLAVARSFARQRRAGEHVHVVLASDGADLSWPRSSRAPGEDAWTVIEVGTGDVDDETLSAIAVDHDGHLLALDTPEEARRAFARLARQGPIAARDVQIQVAFDPTRVAAYRLVGHADLELSGSEFRGDAPAKDRVPGGPHRGRARAGELAAGRGFTVFYELVPAAGPDVAPLTVHVRARVSGRDRRWTHEVRDDGRGLAATSDDFRFTAAVAELGLLVNGGPRGEATLEQVRALAAGALGRDGDGTRAGFVALLERSAAPLAARAAEWAPFACRQRCSRSRSRTTRRPTSRGAALSGSSRSSRPSRRVQRPSRRAGNSDR